MIKFKHLLCYSVLFCTIHINNTPQEINQNEKINIGDDFDTSIFDTAKTIKNFISASYGLGMNDARVTKSKWLWNKTITNTVINKQILNNIRTHKHKFLLNNKCFNFTVAYNIVLSKHFVFLFFLKFVSQNHLFWGNEFLYRDVVSVYPQAEELFKLNSKKGSLTKEDQQIRPLSQKIYNKSKKHQNYNACVENYLDKNVLFLLIKNFGLGVSFAWYSNMQNLAKSWFVKFPLVHVGKQWCSEICIDGAKNSLDGGESLNTISYNPQTLSVRINSLIIMAGIEIGYAHFSAEFFINLTPTFNSRLTYCKDVKDFNNAKDPKNLYCCGFVLKYNHC